MRLPIVDTYEPPVELDWLRIQQVVPATPVRKRLDVRRDPRERRRFLHNVGVDEVDVDPHGEHAELDAMLAGELVAAVRVLVESGAPSDEVTDATGAVRHEVEVSWGGLVHRYVVDGEPVDDAIGGVLRLASALLDADPHVTGVEPD
jgi:hypothetical protein